MRKGRSHGRHYMVGPDPDSVPLPTFIGRGFDSVAPCQAGEQAGEEDGVDSTVPSQAWEPAGEEDGVDESLGWATLAAETQERRRKRSRSCCSPIALFAVRLIVIWLLHVVDFCTDVRVAALFYEQGKNELFGLAVTFIALPTLFRCLGAQGHRIDKQRPWYHWCSVPVLGELVYVMDTIQELSTDEHPQLSDSENGRLFVVLRAVEAALEALPEGMIQAYDIYEELLSGRPILLVQWASFLASAVAIGVGLTGLTMWIAEDPYRPNTPADQKLAMTAFFSADALLRIITVCIIFRQVAQPWVAGYFAVTYLLVVSLALVRLLRLPEDMFEWCLSVVSGPFLACFAFLIPADLILGWGAFLAGEVPVWGLLFLPVLHLSEHLAVSIVAWWAGSPLGVAPLAVWGLCATSLPLALGWLRGPCRRWRGHQLDKVRPAGADEADGETHPARCLNQPCEEPGESDAWNAKVAELGMRAFTLGHLLDFCKALGTAAVMPHFEATESTTNDVVRQAIIPMSRRRGSWSTLRRGLGANSPEGRALATCMQDGQPLQAMRMVTHNWDNLFAHLVAAVIADALGDRAFQGVLDTMGEPGGLDRLGNKIASRNAFNVTYWICAISINQHAGICGGFGPEPLPGTPEFWAFDAKRRDSITGAIYPLCSCCTEKHFNYHRDACELNKFDSMMRRLSLSPVSSAGGFRQIVALDTKLDLFGRAWCVAELVEGRKLQLEQVLIIRDGSCLPKSKTKAMRKIRVENCKASRPEDVEDILKKIGNKEEFNKELQRLLFEGQNSLISDLRRHVQGFADGGLYVAAVDALF